MENECVFNIDIANALLDYIKNNTSEDSVILDSLKIVVDNSEENPGTSFGYFPNQHTIYISEGVLNSAQDEFVIDYINEIFNLNLKNTPLTRSIHVFLHEVSHALDLGTLTEEQRYKHLKSYEAYNSKIERRDCILMNQIVNTSIAIQNCIKDAQDNKITTEKYLTTMDKLTKKYNELRDKQKQVERDYRLNPAERIADEGAAKFFRLLKPIMPQLFKEQEHLITRKKEV